MGLITAKTWIALPPITNQEESTFLMGWLQKLNGKMPEFTCIEIEHDEGSSIHVSIIFTF